MTGMLDRRHEWKRIIGLERRGAPLQTLEGHTLPDPTLLKDEEFEDLEAGKPAEKVQDSDVVNRLS